jgi:predicted thioredoxin/glutaredoxin
VGRERDREEAFVTPDELVRVMKAALLESFEEIVQEDGLRMAKRARASLLRELDAITSASLRQPNIEAWTEEQVRAAARAFVREALAELRPS